MQSTPVIGQTGDSLSQPHTNIPCVRKRSSKEKVSRKGRGAMRGLNPPTEQRAREKLCAVLVLCKLAGEKQTSLTPGLAPGLLILPEMAWESTRRDCQQSRLHSQPLHSLQAWKLLIENYAPDLSEQVYPCISLQRCITAVG